MPKRARAETVTVPVVEERAVVRKQRRVTGAVQVRTEVSEEVQRLRLPLETEAVEVQRVPIDRWVEAPVPDRQEGDTLVISVHEQVVVTRLKVVEEIRLTRRRRAEEVTREVRLRREEAMVERLDPDEPGAG